MGVAILWVILYHMVAKGGEYFSFGFLNPLLSQGDSGVDIFLLLSGFGLFYAYQKSDLYTFYIHRLVRIMPIYFLIVMCYSIIVYDFHTFLYSFSTIGFWVGKSWYDWYIPTIMLYYLIFPLMVKLVEKFKILFFIFCTTIVSAIIVYLQIKSDLKFGDIRMFALSRIPIFVLGTYWGMLSYRQDKVSSTVKILCYIGFVLGFVLFLVFIKFTDFPLRSGVRQLFHIIYVPGFCLLFPLLLDKCKGPISSLLPRCLNCVGVMSLELYLVHIKWFAYMPFFNYENRWTYGIIILLLTFLIAILLHNFINAKIKKVILGL